MSTITVQALRQEKRDFPILKRNQDHRLCRKIAKAEEAIAQGVNPKRAASGMSGALICRDLRSRPLGVFKSIEEGRTRSIFYRMKRWISGLFGFTLQEGFSSTQGKISSMYAEIAASMTDTHFGFNLVPKTGLAVLNGIRGSFMIWAKTGVPAAAYIPQKSISEQELNLFQRFVILDYLLGNLDRHLGNWIVQTYGRMLINIVAIDNGNAFLAKNPRKGFLDFFARKSHYAWKSHILAGPVFSRTSQELMASITENSMDELINLLHTTFSDKNLYPDGEEFLTKDVIFHFRQRAEVLRKMAANPGTGPRDLAALYSTDAIQAFLRE